MHKVFLCGIWRESCGKDQKRWAGYPTNFGTIPCVDFAASGCTAFADSRFMLNLADISALESILISVTTALDVEMAVLRKFVNELLTQLETDIDRERLRNMLIYSKKLSAFEKKATLIRDSLAEILDNGIYSGSPSFKCR